MKWLIIAMLAGFGAHAVYSAGTDYAVADDLIVMKACGTEKTCIRRHNLARRMMLGTYWNEPALNRITWTRDCPTHDWVAFQACYDAARR